MSQTLSHDQTRSLNIESPESIPCSKPNRDPRKAQWGLFAIFDSLSWANLAALLRRWYAAFRSFRGHIQLVSPRMGGWVEAGPACRLQGKHLVRNERTLASVESIKKLLSIHPWADPVDCRIFLLGFEAGEKYNMGRVRYRIPSEQHTHVEIDSCDQLSQVPDTGTDTGSHSGGHAQG
jgi:hypothetical protein